MNRTLLLLLTTAVSAFLLGVAALRFLDSRYTPAVPTAHVSTNSSDFVVLDTGTLICWGKLDVQLFSDKAANDREIKTQFPHPFAAPPTVTLAFRPRYSEGTAGVVWNVYNVSVEKEKYSARILPLTNAQDPNFSTREVGVDYIAIGKTH